MAQSKALLAVAAKHLAAKDLPGDVDYTCSTVAGVALYLLRTAMQDPRIYQEIAPIVREFTPAEHKHYAKYTKDIYASLRAESNAALAKSIANELRGQ